MKTVSEMGEFGLIERIQQILLPIQNVDLILGIGDDTAVLRKDEHTVLLITCDIQVENQHFRLNYLPPYQIGRRAMAVNLSDIAAMGGKPTFALVSLGFPKSFPTLYFEGLFQGMQDELSQFDACIIGGNLSGTARELVIDITLLGEAKPNAFLMRSNAQNGDRIFITGTPGISGAGFYALEKFGINHPPEFSTWVKKHLQPIPRIKIGQKIAESGYATSMIDLSDGIASDLRHICKSSHVGAELKAALFPEITTPEILAHITQKSAMELALHSGEDYELLFTVKPETPAEFIKSLADEFKILVTEIGRIIPPASGFYLLDAQANKINIEPKGWDHFSR